MSRKGVSRERQRTQREVDNEAYELLKERQAKSAAKMKLTKAELDARGIELSPKQHELYKGIRNNTLTVCQGPAGTSKTFTACYTSLALLADKKIASQTENNFAFFKNLTLFYTIKFNNYNLVLIWK